MACWRVKLLSSNLSRVALSTLALFMQTRGCCLQEEKKERFYYNRTTWTDGGEQFHGYRLSERGETHLARHWRKLSSSNSNLNCTFQNSLPIKTKDHLINKPEKNLFTAFAKDWRYCRHNLVPPRKSKRQMRVVGNDMGVARGRDSRQNASRSNGGQ